MARFRSIAIFLIFAAAAWPVLAGTYKWVDENGVTNYSNKPPLGKVSKTQVVEERISVVAPDPSVGWAIAAMRARAARQAQYDEAYWQQRLRYMLAAQTSYPTAYGMGYGPYTNSYYPYYPYYAPFFAVGSARRFSTSFMHPSSFLSSGRRTTHAGRGSFR